MYSVFLERNAEKNLKQLSAKMHDRVVAAIQALGRNPPCRLPKAHRRC